MVVSFGSVLVGQCSTWDSRLVCYCLDNSKICNETMDGMDSWLVWSFSELMMGRWFEYGPNSQHLPCRQGKHGQDIAEGWSGIVVFHRGDEKYHQKAYHMNPGATSEQICWHCRASRVRDSPNLYTFFGPNAPYRETALTLEAFICETTRPNPWVRLPGFHPEVLIYDWLHCFDLGLLSDAAASVTWP